MLVSDKYQVVLCLECGSFAVYNDNTKSYQKCYFCNKVTDFGRYTIPYAYKLLIHLLGAMGINLRPKLIDGEENRRSILSGRNDLAQIINLQEELNEPEENLEEEEEIEDGAGEAYE